ncbi:MAG: cytidylate kinase-like family protein [Bacteroidaceae bacterium]|nr:cytidylate kinase-like family protein [Bacteroidaceae bacterium]MBQ9171111.1 cytidylate kinase-like family protein [Bacteroidaceae bacterium]MBQ9293798.1 cytidylate kinase-like family protein [Bacteroidaceae bacterium]
MMNKNEKFVITINRELGSGGRTVGRKVAERLGVQFYDKAIIKALTNKLQLSEEKIEQMKGQSHHWWHDFRFARGVGMGMIPIQFTEAYGGELCQPTSDMMFRIEKELLQGITADESCVVAGRCGFFVLRQHPNHLNILIQASMDFRTERLARKQNMTQEEARKAIEKVDMMRENYVTKYCGTSRYDTRNYDLVLRADGKTEDELADIIMQYINGK